MTFLHENKNRNIVFCVVWLVHFLTVEKVWWKIWTYCEWFSHFVSLAICGRRSILCVCCQVQLHSFKKREDWAGWKLLGREIALALGATEHILGGVLMLQKKRNGWIEREGKKVSGRHSGSCWETVKKREEETHNSSWWRKQLVQLRQWGLCGICCRTESWWSVGVQWSLETEHQWPKRASQISFDFYSAFCFYSILIVCNAVILTTV